MIRFFFRLLATISLAVAVIMAVLDATRSIAADQIVMTALSQSWQSVSPGSYAASEAAVSEVLAPYAWDPIVLTLLSAPGFAVFLVLALLLYLIGRRPERRTSRFASI
ncbi:MAG: hypothetical protein JJ864_05120 [Rhizobiaceae bacterium]|nr:hypothetical protein [Rhizobiaceae bacterium]